MIKVNGNIYKGRSIIVSGSQVIIDGVIKEDSLGTDKEIKVDAKGFAGVLTIEGNATINGHIDGQVHVKGSLNCRSIFGDVSAGGSINCDDIEGNANACGSINCDSIGGNVSTGVIQRGE